MLLSDYAYGSIMKWAHDTSADGYDFFPRGGFDRSKSVDYLTNSVLNDKLLLPYVRTVDLPMVELQPSPLHLMMNVLTLCLSS